MYGGQHVVVGKFVSMWNMEVSLRYVRWPTCRWRLVCFYVECEGFTKICTVANMSLAASLRPWYSNLEQCQRVRALCPS